MAAKAKRVDRKYVLSDESVNCYGFRLLTSGYQLADYARNPIGYYMHDRAKGVVVKWDGLAIEGDQLTGYPIINLSNARGEQTLQEVEDGFLNAASIGDIVVLEWSAEPAMMLAGQTGATITKWTNKECSLVDVPGNGNALARLFDIQDNPISIADLPGLAHIPQYELPITTTLKNEHMSKIITIPVTENLLATIGVDKTDPKEAEIVTAIADLAATAGKVPALVTEVADLKTKLADLQAKGTKDKVKAVLAKAQTDKGLSNEFVAKLAIDYAANPDGLEALVATMPKHQLVTDLIKKAGGTEDLSATSWDELHKAEKLPALKKDDPETYKVLFKAEFGYEPKM